MLQLVVATKSMDLLHKYYQVKNVQLHVVEAGNREGEILLLLHGFPEFWWGWRHQISYFVEKGYRVVMPDQRGYNLSSRPAGKEQYKMEELSSDIALLIPQLNREKVYLAGHDWGGAVAWAIAIRYPQLLHKLIVLNLPHPQVMKHYLRTSLQQILRSSYIGFFQIPFLPEALLSLFDYKLLERSMQTSSAPNTFSQQDMLRYKQAWKKSGALKSMLNWYRAALFGTLELDKTVTTPTLLVWGKQDQFLSYQMARSSIEMCENGRLIIIEDATHWLHHEKAEQVNKLLFEFMS